MSANSIHCLVYSHPTVVQRLREAAFKPLAGRILVELAPEPTLAHALGLETPASFPGVAGILAKKHPLGDLAVELRELPVPIVLAPGAETSPKALEDAVALLPDHGTHGQISILVHVRDLDLIRFALASVDKLSVLWDLADLPGSSLTGLADFLAAEDLLTPGFWGGFHPYEHPDRPVPPENREAMEQILAPFAATA